VGNDIVFEERERENGEKCGLEIEMLDRNREKK
jgi:hypothetical protein